MKIYNHAFQQPFYKVPISLVSAGYVADIYEEQTDMVKRRELIDSIFSFEASLWTWMMIWPVFVNMSYFVNVC